MNKYEEHIASLFETYLEYVYDYADIVFSKLILPWLKEHHLTFVAGNGGFYIGHTPETPEWFINKYYGYSSGSIDIDKIDKEIASILCSEVKGMDANTFGSLMPDYDGEVDQ
jgi:hypothetical protein